MTRMFCWFTHPEKADGSLDRTAFNVSKSTIFPSVSDAQAAFETIVRGFCSSWIECAIFGDAPLHGVGRGAKVTWWRGNKRVTVG